jgi:hypothetical protein
MDYKNLKINLSQHRQIKMLAAMRRATMEDTTAAALAIGTAVLTKNRFGTDDPATDELITRLVRASNTPEG